MAPLNYQKRFACLVQSGMKRQTIRAARKRPFRRGETLHHFVGMRTRQCCKLGISVCTRVSDIQIYDRTVKIDGRVLYPENIERLAKNDGFASVEDFFAYFDFTRSDSFKGQFVCWREINASS